MSSIWLNLKTSSFPAKFISRSMLRQMVCPEAFSEKKCPAMLLVSEIRGQPLANLSDGIGFWLDCCHNASQNLYALTLKCLPGHLEMLLFSKKT